jgi:hypothetical protein
MIRDSIIFWRLIQEQDGGQRLGIDASLRVLWFSQLLSQNEDFPWRLNAQPDHAFFDRKYLDVSANAGQENHFPTHRESTNIVSLLLCFAAKHKGKHWTTRVKSSTNTGKAGQIFPRFG